MNPDTRRYLTVFVAGLVCAGVLYFLWSFLLRGLPGH